MKSETWQRDLNKDRDQAKLATIQGSSSNTSEVSGQNHGLHFATPVIFVSPYLLRSCEQLWDGSDGSSCGDKTAVSGPWIVARVKMNFVYSLCIFCT